MKYLILLIAAGVLAILTTIKREQARKKLEMLEGGKICIHCNATNVTPGQAGMVCGTCGRTTSWGLINQPTLSNEEFEKISKRDSRGPMQ